MKATDLFTFTGWSKSEACGPRKVAIRASEVVEISRVGQMTTMAHGNTEGIQLITRLGFRWLLPETAGQTFETVCKALTIDEA